MSHQHQEIHHQPAQLVTREQHQKLANKHQELAQKHSELQAAHEALQ